MANQDCPTVTVPAPARISTAVLAVAALSLALVAAGCCKDS